MSKSVLVFFNCVCQYVCAIKIKINKMSVGLLNKSSYSVRHRGTAWIVGRLVFAKADRTKVKRSENLPRPLGHSVMKTPDSRQVGVDARASAGSRSRRGEPRRLAGELSNERDGDGLGGKRKKDAGRREEIRLGDCAASEKGTRDSGWETQNRGVWDGF
ncbi:hypothetical protein GGI43DRAFT_401318 [Trichoderma evansii]